MSEAIKVFVTDDHSIVRKGIRATLELESDMEFIGEASNGSEAVERVASLKPDVILMDLMMPVMDGVEAIRAIKAENPNIRILVLTTFAGEDKIFPAIKAGALGYQLKDSEPDELIEAIRQVYRGESALHPIVARKVLQELSQPAKGEQAQTPDPLTPREVEVLKLVAQGLENPGIAEKLVISEATVRTHLSNIMTKLHLASRTQVALFALRKGLASLDNDA